MAKGSRGGQGKKAPQRASEKILETKSNDELQKFLQGNNIRMDDKVKSLKHEETKQAMAGALHVVEEFGATSYFKGFDTDSLGVMSANRFSGEISFNPNYFNPGARDLVQVMNGSTYHPANQSAYSTGAHEGGHIVEGYLYQKMGMGIDDMIKRKVATQIVGDAAKEMKKQLKAAGKPAPGINDLVGQISRYATKNRSEAFAEAVADVVANKDKAHPFSKIIWDKALKMAGK